VTPMLCFSLLRFHQPPAGDSARQDAEVADEVDQHPAVEYFGYEHEVVVEAEERNRTHQAEDQKRSGGESSGADDHAAQHGLCAEAADQNSRSTRTDVVLRLQDETLDAGRKSQHPAAEREKNRTEQKLNMLRGHDVRVTTCG
jgi:hypothetical protein